LIILDTCYAAKGGSNTAGPTTGANEVIAATNEVNEAPGVSRLSFTRVLVRVLKNFAEKHRAENLQLSAVWLCTHMRNYYYDQELKKPPYYVSLVNYRFESCRIVPRPDSRNRFLGTISPLIPPDQGPFRVTVAIHLKETPSGDLVSWLQGQGAPAGYTNGVELIKIQAAHLANSSMLLVTMPPAVWLLLPSDIPCTFVGVTRSDNLLTQVRRTQRSAAAEVGTEKPPSSSMEEMLDLDPPPPYEEKAVLLSRNVFERQLHRQKQYWIDRASGNVRGRLSPDRYDYSRLAPEEFRLIELLPGQENDRLIGRLITVGPTSAPPYVGLSYVWGPPRKAGQDPPSILLGEIEIELLPNLASAMRALRSLHQNTHIWIDALCVDQDNLMEKTVQITLMADIYRLSESVAVWLGGTTSYGKLAFSFASWITKHPDLVANIAEQHLKVLLTAFFDMIRNSWFQRKWIIADFVLAKEVNLHYGKDVLSWKIMAEAVYVLRNKATDLLRIFLHKNKNADSFVDFLADFGYQGVNEYVDLRGDM
jgi:Heterokaryon incompatibility protein (HET)